MLRLAAALLVRMGLVLLVLAVLGRLLPIPNRADVMADDFAIAIFLVLVLAASIYLRLTRDAAGTDAAGTSREQRISDLNSSYSALGRRK
jgi:hypothetical protein